MAGDWRDEEGLPDKRPDHHARRAAQRRSQVLRRRLVAVGSIVVVAVAVIIVLSSAGGGGGGKNDAATAAVHKHPAKAKPKKAESQKVTNATPQADWKPDTGPVPILEYHVLGSPPEGAPYPELYVGRTDFEKQMDWLEEHGYEAVTLEQVEEAWYHGGKLPPKPIVLSFDDGYRPQYTFALPTLRKHGWAGVLNLKAEGSELYESNVKAMIAAGWELAAHTDPPPRPDRTRARGTERRSRRLAQDPPRRIRSPGQRLLLSRRQVRRNRDQGGRSGRLHRERPPRSPATPKKASPTNSPASRSCANPMSPASPKTSATARARRRNSARRRRCGLARVPRASRRRPWQAVAASETPGSEGFRVGSQAESRFRSGEFALSRT